MLAGDNGGLTKILGRTSRRGFMIAIRGGIGLSKTGHPGLVRRSRAFHCSRVGCAGCLVDFGWCNRREEGGRLS